MHNTSGEGCGQPHTLAGAQRGAAALGEEQGAWVAGGPAAWEARPIPDGPRPVGMDGGSVRAWEEQPRHGEVMVGKRTRAVKREEDAISASKGFGLVQSDATKPQRRLLEGLTSPGHQLHQPRTFRSDSGATGRELPL